MTSIRDPVGFLCSGLGYFWIRQTQRGIPDISTWLSLSRRARQNKPSTSPVPCSMAEIGVSTDRQTDRQTDGRTETAFPLTRIFVRSSMQVPIKEGEMRVNP